MIDFMLIIICGLPGVGKTYFAKELAKKINAQYLSSDSIRMKTLGERTYSQEEKDGIYRLMSEEAEGFLDQGQEVVLDATFYLKKYRDMMCRMARVKGADCKIIECVLDEGELHKRLEKRKNEKSESEADMRIHQKVKEDFEKIAEEHLVIDTADPPGGNLDKAIGWIRNK